MAFGGAFFARGAEGTSVCSSSDGTSKMSWAADNFGGFARVFPNVLPVPSIPPGLRSGPLFELSACFLGRSGDVASSDHFAGAARRADLPYVTTFLRRSAMVNAEDMDVAISGA